MSNNTNNLEIYYKGLHGLRGLAALAVFGVHYNQIVEVDFYFWEFDLYLLLKNGEYGVGLFFVLSGLLLSQPFWQSILHQKPWPNIKSYFIFRAARIIPAYYVALTILILVSGYWRFPQAWSDILLHYSFLFNYVEFSIFSINAPFWSLAVELQFYCLLPVLFFVVRRQSLTLISFYLLLFSFLSYALHVAVITQINSPILWPENTILTWVRPNGAVVTHSLLGHIPHFIIGIVTGGLLCKLQSNRPNFFEAGRGQFDVVFGCCLCVIILLISTPLGNYIQIPFGRYGLPLIPTLIAFLIFSAPITKYFARILESHFIKKFGQLSYGVYIYHLPALMFVDTTMASLDRDAREQWYFLAFFALLLTLFFALLSSYLIERPILKLVKNKLS